MFRTSALIVSLIFGGLIIYAPDLTHTLFFDDESLIVQNYTVHTLSFENAKVWFSENAFAGAGKTTDYYRPLLLASFAAQYAVHGEEPIGYFLINNLLHAFNAVLIFFLFRKLIGNEWMAYGVALIFLIHPMQSENVAYVSGRGDLLSSFFMVSGLLVWVYFLEKKRILLATILSICLLCAALLSRENGVVFPLLAASVYVAFLTRDAFLQSLRRLALLLTPHVVVVLGYIALRLTVLNFRDFLAFGNADTTGVYVEHISVRIYTFAAVLVEYVRTFLFPIHVHERFTFPYYESFFMWPVWVVLLGVCASILWLFFRYHADKDVTGEPVSLFRVSFFAFTWFFSALAPASGIIPTNVIIQDHRLYLAHIGISMLGVYGLMKLHTALRHQYFARVSMYGIGVVIILVLSGMTMERARIWGDHKALFLETLHYEPGAVKAMNGLAVALINENDLEGAERYLRQAIDTKDAPMPEVFNNMGYIRRFGTEPNPDEARLFFLQALELNPRSWFAAKHLSELAMEAGSTEAITYLTLWHSIRPKDPNVPYNLARVYAAIGDYESALKWLDTGSLLVLHNTEALQAFESLRAEIPTKKQE